MTRYIFLKVVLLPGMVLFIGLLIELFIVIKNKRRNEDERKD